MYHSVPFSERNILEAVVEVVTEDDGALCPLSKQLDNLYLLVPLVFEWKMSIAFGPYVICLKSNQTKM